MAETQRCRLYFTDRAKRDLRDIRDYSIDVWGKKAAKKYVADFEDAFQRIQQHPGLLQVFEDFHADLCYYRMRKHLVICDLSDKSQIVVLAIVHASMDLPSRLAESYPTLAAEAEILRLNLGKVRRRE